MVRNLSEFLNILKELKVKRYCLLSLGLVISGFYSFSVQASTRDIETVLIDTPIQSFARDFWTFEIGQNYPQSFSIGAFETKGFHPILGYRYNLGSRWMMGVGGGFKTFKRLDDRVGEGDKKSSFTILSLYHESHYLFRLDHPSYFLIGPKIIYLFPAKRAMFPVSREDAFEVEIGGGLSLSLVRQISREVFISFRVERWRGTKTSKLNGLEIAMGFSWSASD